MIALAPLSVPAEGSSPRRPRRRPQSDEAMDTGMKHAGTQWTRRSRRAGVSARMVVEGRLLRRLRVMRYTSSILLAGFLAIVAGSCADSDELATTTTSSTISQTTLTTAGSMSSSTTSTTITVEAVEPETLVGDWRTVVAGAPWYFRFEDDGSWEAMYFLDGNPFDFGTYEFDGRELTLHSSPDVTGSDCAGTTGSYVVSFSDDTRKFNLPRADARDDCGGRRGALIQAELTRQP